MQVTPSQYTSLVAIDNKNKFLKIPNHILRKPADVRWQRRKLHNHSLLITCNYIFNERKFQWSSNIRAICHPFRKPHCFKGMKTFLFSESDFCDKVLAPTEYSSESPYDFVYFTIDSLQGIMCKGLYMLPAIDLAARQANLKGLVVNYGPPIVKYRKPKRFTSEWLLNTIRKRRKRLTNLEWCNKLMSPKEMCSLMKSVRFVIFPSTRDASPRMIPESLIRGVPVLVNKNIYGGWKYINEHTGLFFDAPQMEECYSGDWKDKELQFADGLADEMLKMSGFDSKTVEFNYYQEYGFSNSAKRLAEIFNEVSGSNYHMVCYKEFKKILKRIRR